MKIFRSLVIPLMLIAVLMITTLTTACPSESSIQKAAKASSALANLTLDAVRTTKQAFDSNLITLAQKDVIAAKLVTLSKGGIAFNTAVKQLENVYQSGNMPPDKFEILSRLFDQSVISPFLAVLENLGALKNAPGILAAIDVIRTTVLTIAAVFGKTSLNLTTRAVMQNG